MDNATQVYSDSLGLRLPPGSAVWRDLAHALARGEIEALMRSTEIDQAQFGGQTKDSLVRPPSGAFEKQSPTPLKELFDLYIISRQAAGYHKDGGSTWRQPIDALIKYLGHSDARKITKQNLLDWRDSLLALGMSAKTVSCKYLAAIRAVLTWGFDNARLPTNEATTVKQAVPKKVRSREIGYTDKEAIQILIASRNYRPSYAQNPSQRESVHITSAKQWVPLLCAFTGARVTEMTQLRKEDVRQEGERWILRITPDVGSVKSGQYRDVPLHKQVVELGFIEFVRSSKPGPMFHGAKDPIKYLANARTTGGRLTEWLHALKLVPTGVAPNHGWRHRFKTQGRELAMSDRVLDAIQGHAGKNASDDYGDVTIKARLKMIDALPEYDFDGQLADALLTADESATQG